MASALLPPPRNAPTLATPPPSPNGADRHLAPKAEDTLGTAPQVPEEHFLLVPLDLSSGGGRHLVTIPPPSHGRDRPDVKGGVLQGGMGVG